MTHLKNPNSPDLASRILICRHHRIPDRRGIKKHPPVVDKSKWGDNRTVTARAPWSSTIQRTTQVSLQLRDETTGAVICFSCTGTRERVSRRIATVLSRREVPVRIPPFVAVEERGIPAASRALDRKNERRIPELDKEAAVTGNAV